MSNILEDGIDNQIALGLQEMVELMQREDQVDYQKSLDLQEMVEEVQWAGEVDVEDKLAVGKLKYGCKHYRRRCRIRAPCCNEIFGCRHCHNEAKNTDEVDESKRHDVPRHHIEKVICSLCEHEQDVKQVCEKCGVCMGDYYCDKCKFFDDETEKGQYHCDACGICRIGGRENFFHCDRCGSCYTVALQNSHPCVENAMHQNCPVCVEYLFDSVIDISVLPCGHTIHRTCLHQMILHSQFCCPICSKSIQDMSRYWRLLDEEAFLTPMPEEYRNKRVWVLCNDCGTTSNVQYHVIGLKCAGCGSYNTRSTSPPARISSESNLASSVGSFPDQRDRAIAP